MKALTSMFEDFLFQDFQSALPEPLSVNPDRFVPDSFSQRDCFEAGAGKNVKPRIGMNQFGGESVTYEGIGATKKWERIEKAADQSL
ncbi:hypothetical protein [Succinimonas amylolytica]|uniref:hypothetical protein n=1 Tax=Succinimonas amylolytica TaxID=83769 RepID=UPI0012FA5661|nr:hypothetical protein [Succinimonas amylolytica]